MPDVFPPLVFSDLGSLTAAAVVVALSQIVHVAVGFGASMVALGLLALLCDGVTDIVVVLLLLTLPSEAGVALRCAREGLVRWPQIVWCLVGIAVGVPMGALVLRDLAPGRLLPALGAVLVGAAAVSLLGSGRTSRPQTVPLSLGAGWASGLLTGAFGIGAPPLLLYHQFLGTPKAPFRAQMMSVFVVATAIRVPVYAATGLLTAPRLATALCLLPASLLGAWLGERLHVGISEALFRRVLCAGLLVIGLGLVFGDG